MASIYFTAFSTREDAVELATVASQQLSDEGFDASVHLLDGAATPALGPEDLVVSLGGDGTFLRSAHLAHDGGARVLAVNLGQVGFLLDVPADELVESTRGALSDDGATNRLALSVTWPGADEPAFALNEVVVEHSRAGHMARVRTYVNDVAYLTYSADGVMVATPTGSTAYNLSAGGPILDATLSALVLTPIAPHFTIDRSIVVPPDSRIRLLVEDKPATLVADGQTIGSLQPGEAVEVTQSPTSVRVVATQRFDLATRLRRSLREGHA